MVVKWESGGQRLAVKTRDSTSSPVVLASKPKPKSAGDGGARTGGEFADGGEPAPSL